MVKTESANRPGGGPLGRDTPIPVGDRWSMRRPVPAGGPPGHDVWLGLRQTDFSTVHGPVLIDAPETMDSPDSAQVTERSVDSADVLIAICTLRERQNVVRMLAALRDAVPQSRLMVVDDNSDDGTADLAGQFAATDGNCEVVRRQGRGLGGAIIRTMKEAIDGGHTYLVNLDADFSHDPAAVPRLLSRAEQPDAPDVVVGSRYVAGGRIEGWPWRRRMMSRWINRLAIRKLKLPVSDCSGSMRCYRVEALRTMDPRTLRSNGYSILEEILWRLRESGAVMAEVPITFIDRQFGNSKLTLREALRSFWRIIRLG